MTDPLSDEWSGSAGPESHSPNSGDLDDSMQPNDSMVSIDTTSHNPFPNAVDPHHPHHPLLAQVQVEAAGGHSSAFLADIQKTHDDSSLKVVGVKHGLTGSKGLKDTNVGDPIDVWLPGYNDDHPVQAEVVYIHNNHDRFVARLDPATSEAIRQNFAVHPVLHLGAQTGEEVGFTHLPGVRFPVLRHGVIAGDFPVLRHGVIAGNGDESAGLKTLTGTEGTAGSSGSPVFDREGHLVGQVVAYDAKSHINLMSSAEQILGDLQDFRNGVNTEPKASPVPYNGAVFPAVRRF